MFRIRASFAILIAGMCLLGKSANAQNEKDYKNEFSGSFGRVFISDQGIHGPNAPAVNPFVRSGRGYAFEASYARALRVHPVLGVSAEVPVVIDLDEDVGSGGNVVPTGYRQIFVAPSLRLNIFPETAVSPWVSLGGGIAHFTEDKNLIYYGTNPGGSKTSGVLQGGIGLDVKVWRRFSVRGEVRDFWSGTPDLPLAETGKTRQHSYFVGVGVVWHF